MLQPSQDELRRRQHNWLIGRGITPSTNTGPNGGSDGL